MPPPFRRAPLAALIAGLALSTAACAENRTAAAPAGGDTARSAPGGAGVRSDVAAAPPAPAASSAPSAGAPAAPDPPATLPAAAPAAQVASAAGMAPPKNAPAAAAPPSAKPFVAHDETLPEAVAQADGITNAVTDRLWLATDHFWHRGDYYRIVSLLRVCVEMDPTWTDAYGDGAWLLWSLGDTAGADRFLKYGVNRRPELWDLEYEFGWHLYNTKRYADALPYLKSATENKNADAVAWKMLAHCYDKLGRTADSVATWQTVVKRFPNDPAGKHNLEEMEAKRNGAPAAPPAQPSAPASQTSPNQ